MPVLLTFQPDDARGSIYRSGASGQCFRPEIPFDATMPRAGTNEITLQINGAGAAAELSNWAPTTPSAWRSPADAAAG